MGRDNVQLQLEQTTISRFQRFERLDSLWIRSCCMDRSYQAENARSRPLPEAKLPWASPVVGWVTTCEPDVTICTFASFR